MHNDEPPECHRFCGEKRLPGRDNELRANRAFRTAPMWFDDGPNCCLKRAQHSRSSPHASVPNQQRDGCCSVHPFRQLSR